MTFLGVGAGVAIVAMSNMVAMGPAVAIRVRSPPLVWVIAASSPAAATPGLGCELVTEGLTWLVRVELEAARKELEAMSCSRMAFLLEAALARLSRALSMESRRPGSRVVVWAELALPK